MADPPPAESSLPSQDKTSCVFSPLFPCSWLSWRLSGSRFRHSSTRLRLLITVETFGFCVPPSSYGFFLPCSDPSLLAPAPTSPWRLLLAKCCALAAVSNEFRRGSSFLCQMRRSFLRGWPTRLCLRFERSYSLRTAIFLFSFPSVCISLFNNHSVLLRLAVITARFF